MCEMKPIVQIFVSREVEISGLVYYIKYLSLGVKLGWTGGWL